MAYQLMLYDFFIAYAAADICIAQQLFDGLAALGAQCFLAARTLHLGDDWDRALPEAQRNSRVTVVIVSGHTDRAFYEREEIAIAVELSRACPDDHRVIPVYIGDAFDGPVPYGLRIKHGLSINADIPPRDACRRLIEVLPLSLGPRSSITASQITYDVDLCMCIDVSNSLQWLVNLARRQLLTLGHDISLHMLEKGKAVRRLRISIITFGSDAQPVMRSPMIELPAGAGMLYQLVSNLRIAGSGFYQSRGLDALELAMKSDWSMHGDRQRHIITVWTDRETARTVDFDTLDYQWNEQMHKSAKRLVLFAPERPEWTTISVHWDYCIHFPVNVDGGFTDIDYDSILSELCQSV